MNVTIIMIPARVRLSDHISIDDLHGRFEITSLEQRCCVQLLLFMYKKSKDVSMHKGANPLRVSTEIIIEIKQ